MTLLEATKLIRQCAEQMDSLYGKVVFDEWAVILAQEEKARLLAYIGPRRENFQKNFAADIADLRTEYRSGSHGFGDFAFSRHGVGTKVEAFMVLGKDIFLICNHTTQSMNDITQNPLWLSAQVPFVELSDQVRASPVVHPA